MKNRKIESVKIMEETTICVGFNAAKIPAKKDIR